MSETTTACIAFGSNLGDRHTTLAGAYAAFTAHPAVTPLARSRLFETAPVGGPDGQGRFLNTVLKIGTTLSPHALLAHCMAVEQQFKRERVIRWDARTLDLDVLLYGDEVIATPDLEIPHPRMHQRRFVLVPLADVAAEVTHPVLGESIASLLSRLPVEPGDVYPVADDWIEAP
jgi:2-amino-4-hydroxy-6-hydroxymethyldihydropteridine diphosphokinase